MGTAGPDRHSHQAADEALGESGLIAAALPRRLSRLRPSPAHVFGIGNQRAVDFHTIAITQQRIRADLLPENPDSVPVEINFLEVFGNAGLTDCLCCRDWRGNGQ